MTKSGTKSGSELSNTGQIKEKNITLFSFIDNKNNYASALVVRVISSVFLIIAEGATSWFHCSLMQSKIIFDLIAAFQCLNGAYKQERS